MRVQSTFLSTVLVVSDQLSSQRSFGQSIGIKWNQVESRGTIRENLAIP